MRSSRSSAAIAAFVGQREPGARGSWSRFLNLGVILPGGAGDPPPHGPPEGPPPGRLIADDTSFIHTFDLDDGAVWSQRLRYSAPWSSVTVVPASEELLIATTSGSNPIFVEVYDITTFGQKDTLEWPDSMFASTLPSLAAT